MGGVDGGGWRWVEVGGGGWGGSYAWYSMHYDIKVNVGD